MANEQSTTLIVLHASQRVTNWLRSKELAASSKQYSLLEREDINDNDCQERSLGTAICSVEKEKTNKKKINIFKKKKKKKKDKNCGGVSSWCNG